jgi:cytochrome P450
MLAERFAKSADDMDKLAKQARDEGREIEAQFMESAAQGIRLGIAGHLATERAGDAA